MLQHLAGLVRRVQQTGIEVTSSATQLAASGKQLESMMTEQVASTHEVVATTQEIAATSQELARTMQDVTTLSDDTATAAASSQAGLSQMATTMQQMEAATRTIAEKLSAIQERADDITTVITTITKVADQTNLLSLNAAIEAEKAGEYGRGFAVVAREIRRLADQTAVATLAIERIIHEMRAAVTAGVMGMDQFAHEVQQGVEHVRTVGRQLGQIIAQVQALTPRFDTVNHGMQAQVGGHSRSVRRWGSSARRRSRPPRHSPPRTRLSHSSTPRRKGCTTRFPASTTGRCEPGRWRTLKGAEDCLWNATIAGTISACSAMVRARNWPKWCIATTVRSMLLADVACWSVNRRRSICTNGPKRWPRRKTRIQRQIRSRCCIFRLGREWLALPTHVCQEMAEMRPIHTLPHRSGPVLLGLVNIRGSIRLCVSLRELLGLEPRRRQQPDDEPQKPAHVWSSLPEIATTGSCLLTSSMVSSAFISVPYGMRR